MSINYEQKINEIGHALFRAEAGSSALLTLKSKLISYAYDYVRFGGYFSKLSRKFRFYFPDEADAVDTGKHGNGLEFFTTEIMDTCEDVIKGFSVDKGEFISYFNSAMFNSLNSAIGELVYTELHGGIRTSLKKAKVIARIIKELREDGLDASDINIVVRAAEYDYKLTEEDVRAYKGTVIDAGNVKDAEGNGYEDITPIIRKTTAVMEEEYLDPQVVVAANDRALDVIWMFEYVVNEIPEYRRGYIADCMTSKLSRWIGCYEFRLEEAKLTNWFKGDIFDFYIEKSEPMPMTEIAKKHGMNLSSLSRSFTKFWSHIVNTEIYNAMFESTIKKGQ